MSDDRSLLYLDAPSGLAGDMLVAALMDVGVPDDVVARAIATLSLPGVRLDHTYTERSGIRARRFEVVSAEEQPERTYREIVALLERAALDPAVRDLALAAFRKLGEAEAAVHGVPLDRVHFHEVGAVDSIVDVVAAAACFVHLRATVVCSPLPMGHGRTRSRHGILPLPAPATVHCLRGIPTYDAGIEAELVTPTGACLVAAVCSRFARWPAMRPRATGWGAGSRELADRPNVLRAILADVEPHPLASTELTILEANLDDASPEHVAHALERLRELGARDAWTTPIGMKKGRAATQLSALVDPSLADALARAILRETTSLGVRMSSVRRVERSRRIVEVSTRFGAVPVKIASGHGLPTRCKPEHDVCADLARRHGVAIDEVHAAALEAVPIEARR